MEAVRYKSLMEDAARFFPFGDMAKDAYDKRNQWNTPNNLHYKCDAPRQCWRGV